MFFAYIFDKERDSYKEVNEQKNEGVKDVLIVTDDFCPAVIQIYMFLENCNKLEYLFCILFLVHNFILLKKIF